MGDPSVRVLEVLLIASRQVHQRWALMPHTTKRSIPALPLFCCHRAEARCSLGFAGAIDAPRIARLRPCASPTSTLSGTALKTTVLGRSRIGMFGSDWASYLAVPISPQWQLNALLMPFYNKFAALAPVGSMRMRPSTASTLVRPIYRRGGD